MGFAAHQIVFGILHFVFPVIELDNNLSQTVQLLLQPLG